MRAVEEEGGKGKGEEAGMGMDCDSIRGRREERIVNALDGYC